MKELKYISGLVVLLFMLGACKGKSNAVNNKINIESTGYTPATLRVPVGTTVFWTNKDNVVHTVTSTNSLFHSADIQPGSTFSHSFGGPGSYSYRCNHDNSFQGTITVTNNP